MLSTIPRRVCRVNITDVCFLLVLVVCFFFRRRQTLLPSQPIDLQNYSFKFNLIILPMFTNSAVSSVLIRFFWSMFLSLSLIYFYAFSFSIFLKISFIIIFLCLIFHFLSFHSLFLLTISYFLICLLLALYFHAWFRHLFLIFL